MEQKQIAIKFENQPKIFYYNPDKLDLKIGDFVVVESLRGVEVGKVATNPEKSSSQEPLKPIIRIANANDLNNVNENKKKALVLLNKAKKHIKNFKLDMKIIGAELTLDANKIIISFTAENRVDFRELVKALASDFKMKIELRQIGVRDAVQIMGSVGVCGRPCCCHRYSGDFEHVSIKMAKIQGLSLSPNNISGVCGKLLCCLGYENKEYEETFKLMPKVNSEVITPEGKGKVMYNNLLTKTVQVKINEDIKEFNLEDIKQVSINKTGQNE